MNSWEKFWAELRQMRRDAVASLRYWRSQPRSDRRSDEMAFAREKIQSISDRLAVMRSTGQDKGGCGGERH